jgi:hypothetical protein
LPLPLLCRAKTSLSSGAVFDFSGRIFAALRAAKTGLYAPITHKSGKRIYG